MTNQNTLKIVFALPTKDREEFLIAFLDSLRRSAKYAFKTIPFVYTVALVVDTKQDKLSLPASAFSPDTTPLTLEELGISNFSNSLVFNAISSNIFRASKGHVLYYLSDDIEFEERTILESLKAVIAYDYDYLVCLPQINAPKNQTRVSAFGAMGYKFINRFRNGHFFCPQYSTFYMDEELEMFARAKNKLISVWDAPIVHYHPAFTGKAPDNTHIEHRINKAEDDRIYKLRREKNLVWGLSYEFV